MSNISKKSKELLAPKGEFGRKGCLIIPEWALRTRGKQEKVKLRNNVRCYAAIKNERERFLAVWKISLMN